MKTLRLLLPLTTLTLALLVPLALPATSLAAATNCRDANGKLITVATPGLNVDCSNGKNPIYALLQFFINWGIRLLGVLAILAVVISGIQYIVSQGNPEGLKSAKNRLTNAIIGLVLLALMFLILKFLIPGFGS